MNDLLERIRTEIATALQRFGEHAYHDKGPREVMDTDHLVAEFRDMPAADAAELLNQLAASDDEAQRRFVSHLFVESQDGPDEWFEEMAQHLTHDAGNLFS